MFTQVPNTFCSIHLLQTSAFKYLHKLIVAFLQNLLPLGTRHYSGNVRMLSNSDKEFWKVTVRGKRNLF